MTHPANYTTRDLAAEILGMHDRSYRDMLETATRAINAAISSAVQSERSRCIETAIDGFFDLTGTSEMTVPEIITHTRRGIASAIRARNEATK